MIDAEFALDMGSKFPFNGRPATDWAESAAQGILADLCDRRGIRQALEDIDTETREEIVGTMADIIRTALGE